MKCETYLYFHGSCEAAVNFYTQAVGAEVKSLARFRDAPGVGAPEGFADKILHADLRIGNATVLASDAQAGGGEGGKADFQGFSLSLTADSDAEAEKLFANLSKGGQVQVPMSATFFASRFGMARDRFGVLWTIVAGMNAQN